MLKHLFSYLPKLMVRSRYGALYGIIFPIAYSLIFLVVFSNLVGGEPELNPIPVAVVFQGNQFEKQVAEESFNKLAGQGEWKDDRLKLAGDQKYLLVYEEVADLAAGRQLTEEDKALATIVIDNRQFGMNIGMDLSPSAVNDYRSQVLYTALDSFSSISRGVTKAFQSGQITQTLASIKNISASEDDMASNKQLLDRAEGKNVNANSIFFFAMFGYLCMYFMNTGVSIVYENEAYASVQAMRLTLAPVAKYKLFISNLIAWGIPCILIVWGIYGLFSWQKIPLGTDTGWILMLLSLGVLLGLSFGTALAAILKKRTGLSEGLMIALPLTFSFFSGMMSQEMKIMVNQNFPWFNKINPVALITDGFYYLSAYPTHQQFYQNIMIIICMIVVCLLITYFGLRRTDHASL